MPIPFRDDEDTADLGTAAHLHVATRPEGLIGALFQITARGEPVEFTWNQVTAPPSILWRPGDLRRAALRLLTTTLFETSQSTPTLLVVRGETFPPDFFSADLRVRVPVLSIAISDDGEITSDWLLPAERGSPADELAGTLATRGLLLEPFERADEGLREVGENPHPPAPSLGARERGLTRG